MPHTPGPWKAGFVADSDGKLVWQAVELPDRFSIATVGRYLHRYDAHGSRRPMREISPEEASANARLVAAAPDLLAACEAALGKMLADEQQIENEWGDLRSIDKLRQLGELAPEILAVEAAIAKARGI